IIARQCLGIPGPHSAIVRSLSILSTMTVPTQISIAPPVGLCAYLPLGLSYGNRLTDGVRHPVLSRGLGSEPSHPKSHQVVDTKPNSYMGYPTGERG